MARWTEGRNLSLEATIRNFRIVRFDAARQSYSCQIATIGGSIL